MGIETGSLLAELASHFAARNEAWTAAQVALCQVPAPAYAEGPRGSALLALFESVGLQALGVTPAGNVCGRLGAGGPGPRLAVAAHLDTVFGPEVDVTVRRDGAILRAPGIGDDVSGLVMLPALAEALAAAGVTLPGELWLVGTVGEESLGNLRGARELADEGLAGRPLDAFITLDSATPGQVIRHGTHSHNHDLRLAGPGGHAWGEFGVVNPNLALAQIVARVAEYRLPLSPRTTLNCGILNGGFAPNAIPEQAHGHLNLRSESGEELARLDAWARQAISETVAQANGRRRLGPELSLEHTVAGRQGGETPADSPLVRGAVAAVRRQGWPVSHPYSSTDANAFMAQGIDGVCLYRGEGAGEHTPEEWYDTSTRPAALEALAETVLRYFQAVA